MDIRKISIGADYKSGAMHYIVGQDVLGGSYIIHLIQHDSGASSYKIWIEKNKEIVKLLDINKNYNVDFIENDKKIVLICSKIIDEV